MVFDWFKKKLSEGSKMLNNASNSAKHTLSRLPSTSSASRQVTQPSRSYSSYSPQASMKGGKSLTKAQKRRYKKTHKKKTKGKKTRRKKIRCWSRKTRQNKRYVVCTGSKGQRRR